jgi:hypothetical protein
MSNEDPKAKRGADKGAGAPAVKRDAPVRREAPVMNNNTGRVKFDDRGNAVWEWAVGTGAYATDISTSRLKKLDNLTLSIAEDTPPPSKIVKENPKGMVQGYSPYDSGLLARTEPPRKKDLRRLSEWLKLKKQASANKRDDK